MDRVSSPVIDSIGKNARTERQNAASRLGLASFASSLKLLRRFPMLNRLVAQFDPNRDSLTIRLQSAQRLTASNGEGKTFVRGDYDD